jgi:hypothetical protein
LDPSLADRHPHSAADPLLRVARVHVNGPHLGRRARESGDRRTVCGARSQRHRGGQAMARAHLITIGARGDQRYGSRSRRGRPHRAAASVARLRPRPRPASFRVTYQR